MLGRSIVCSKKRTPNPVRNTAGQVEINPEGNMNVDPASTQFELAFDYAGEPREMFFKFLRRKSGVLKDSSQEP